MNDPEYIPGYDENGNEIWINPNVTESQLNQYLDNTPKDKVVTIVAKRTYWWVLILGIIIFIVYKIKRGKS